MWRLFYFGPSMTSEPSLSFGHLIIPILGLLIPIVAIVAHYLSKAYAERQRHESIREFARVGQPVPPELLADTSNGNWHRSPDGKSNPNRILLPGAVNVGLGLGLMGLFAVMSPGSWLWGIGLLPLCLGLGLVLLWVVVRKQQPGP
jgi:membrane protein implicated in regulation of membrane protease activity